MLSFSPWSRRPRFKDNKVTRHETHETVDGDHSRIETRAYTLIHDIAWERHDWPRLKSVVMVESTREIADKIEQGTRFYITSLVLAARLIGPVIRDGECRVRKDHAPANFTTLKHMAHNLIRKAPGNIPAPKAQSRGLGR